MQAVKSSEWPGPFVTSQLTEESINTKRGRRKAAPVQHSDSTGLIFSLEVESQLPGHRPRAHKVRSAERREKVV